MQLVLKMRLLGAQLGIQVVMLVMVTSEPWDFGMTRIQDILLGIQLGIEVRVLLLSVDQQRLLIIYVLPLWRSHIDINFNPRLVVILHSPLLIGNPVEALFHTQELVLQ